MRHSTVTLAVAIVVSFVAGALAPHLARHAVREARAETAPPLAPAVFDLMALRHDDLPKTSNPEMNTKMLVLTDEATIQIQSGNVAKHIHPQTNEIQYIIEGSGAMWLGNERKEFKPGTLIVIPKGTAHAGTIVAQGPVKAIAIKIPPQPKDDTVFVK
ncbi:MAG TPA: cupin domain-containing protein [Casimicrobiaceae bacterium]|nr:cupin domain-containing protein [Casimicrobiaceae bacterium]